jgi:hypothetical protein
MARRVAVWNGSDADLAVLRAACNRNCSCVPGEWTCDPHDMLSDQTVLDHLAEAAMRRERIQRGEHDPLGEFLDLGD